MKFYFRKDTFVLTLQKNVEFIFNRNSVSDTPKPEFGHMFD